MHYGKYATAEIRVMTTQSEQIVLQLREMLMRGDFEPGEHLQEIPISKLLNVSRTPVRLALAALAQDRLLVYKPQRGFMVREFSTKEIVDAVMVRGELEGMACRLVAENGLSTECRKALHETLEQTRNLIEQGGIRTESYAKWFELNGIFHDLIVQESGNETIVNLIEQINKVPLAAAASFAATSGNSASVEFVTARAQFEHEQIVDAIEHGQAHRAQSLMSEHVFLSAKGKRRLVEKLRTQREEVPMLKLVSSS